MINVFAVALKGRVYFLFAEMKGISPINIAVFHEGNIGIITVVLFLKEAVVETGVDHKKDVIEIKGMSNGVLIEENLFLVLT